MEVIVIVVIGVAAWVAFLFFSMLKKNKNPMNQQCSDEIAQYILSGHFHSTPETVAEIKRIVDRYRFDYFDGPHVASLVEMKLRQYGAFTESTKALLKDIYR